VCAKCDDHQGLRYGMIGSKRSGSKSEEFVNMVISSVYRHMAANERLDISLISNEHLLFQWVVHAGVRRSVIRDSEEFCIQSSVNPNLNYYFPQN
jgi:hypothetical protein